MWAVARAKADPGVRYRLDVRAQQYISLRSRRDLIKRNVVAARASTPALNQARREAAKQSRAERRRVGACTARIAARAASRIDVKFHAHYQLILI
jgi:hypothetical protein